MGRLQAVVAALRDAGVGTPPCTSQHVHIGTEGWSWAERARFAKIWYQQEALVLEALGTLPARRQWYCRPTAEDFRDALARLPAVPTDAELNRAWFGRPDPVAPMHYDPHRYRACNLNNLWRHSHTIEIRAFNGCADPAGVRANIMLALGLAFRARNVAGATLRQREYDPGHGKYQMRTFLLNLGFIGPETAPDRAWLTRLCKGDASWRHADRHHNNQPEYAR